MDLQENIKKCKSLKVGYCQKKEKRIERKKERKKKRKKEQKKERKCISLKVGYCQFAKWFYIDRKSFLWMYSP